MMKVQSLFGLTRTKVENTSEVSTCTKDVEHESKSIF